MRSTANVLPEPLMETESAGRDIRTRQLQSSSSSFRAGTAPAVSPRTRDFRTPRRAASRHLWVSRGDWGRSQLWEQRDWEQTLIHCTIPAHNAEHPTFGNPGTVQQASPALQAVLNSSGNRFGERSDRKGFISHPLPSSACARLTLSVLSEAGSHHSPCLALLLARHKQTQQQLSCTAPRTRNLSLNSLAQDLLQQEQATQ